jgi:hypothetical protein
VSKSKNLPSYGRRGVVATFVKMTLVLYTALHRIIGSKEFIETSLFTRLIYDYLREEEYLGLQVYLLQHPESGKIVSGSGGVRMLRFRVSRTKMGIKLRETFRALELEKGDPIDRKRKHRKENSKYSPTEPQKIFR